MNHRDTEGTEKGGEEGQFPIPNLGALCVSVVKEKGIYERNGKRIAAQAIE